MNQTNFISVVIPVFNEQENLEELIGRSLKACRSLEKKYEIILVDDGSRDMSAKLITRAAEQNQGMVFGVLLNRNYGQHAAVMAGFEVARGDVVVTLDADLQNPPEEIPNLVQKIDEGFDVVGSVRKSRCDTFFRKFASAIINKVVQRTTGVMMHDYGCMLRAYRKNIVTTMLKCNEHSTFIPVIANSFASNPAEIMVRHEKRHGNSKYGFFKLINLQFDLLTCMSTFPLRLLSGIGGIISLMGLGFGIFLFLARLIYGAQWAGEGVFTLFAVLFIFIGAQFVGLGLLGEYTGRIYHDVRQRPRYLIREIVGKQKQLQNKE